MHFGDSIFIFLLALVLFGPKKLPEIGRQAGKLLAEFRRASNEFKFQIQEELRNMEEEERRKKLAEYDAQHGRIPIPEEDAEPSILPPVQAMPAVPEDPYAMRILPEAAEMDVPVRDGSSSEVPEESEAGALSPDLAPEDAAAHASETLESGMPEAAEPAAAAESITSAVPTVIPAENPVKEIPVQEAAHASHHG